MDGVPVVPKGWKAKLSKRKKKYYYVNRETSETQWDPPEGTIFEATKPKKKKRKKTPPPHIEEKKPKLEVEDRPNDGETPDGTKQTVPSAEQLAALFATLKPKMEKEEGEVLVTGEAQGKLKSPEKEEGEVEPEKHIEFTSEPHITPAMGGESVAHHEGGESVAHHEGGESVAHHYSQVARDVGRQTRREREDSPTSRLRSYHNWTKNVLVGCAAGLWGEGATIQVLDLACGRGGDLFKWDKTIRNNRQSIASYLGVDVAYGAIGEAARRASQFHFPHRFDCADLSKQEDLRRVATTFPPNSFHIASMQFALHYFFNREESAHNLFSFMASSLQAGGIFICTYADGNTIVRKLRDKQWTQHRDTGWRPHDVTISNPFYRIEAAGSMLDDLEKSPSPFGHSYRFTLEGAVQGQREYLIPDDVLTAIGQHYGFKTVVESNFQPFTKDVMKMDKHGHAMRYMRVFGGLPELPHDEWECSSLYKVRIMVFDPHNNREAVAKNWILRYLFG